MFGVEFEDGRTLKVETKERERNVKEPRKQRRDKGDNRSLVLSFNGNGPFELPTSLEPRGLPFPLEAIEQIVPELTRIGHAEWQTPEGEIVGLEDLPFHYPQIHRFVPGSHSHEPPWLIEIRKTVEVRFIRTDRLMARRQPDGMPSHKPHPVLSPAVMTYSEELAGEIESTLTRYGALSQSLDRTFPARLVSHTGPEGLPRKRSKND